MKVVSTIFAGLLFLLPLGASGGKLDPICNMGYSYGNTPEQFEEAWTSFIGKWYDAIPPLSPREEKWLNLELNSGDSKRLMRAQESSEYRLYESKRILGNLYFMFSKAEGYSDIEKYVFTLDNLFEYEGNGRYHLNYLTTSGQISLPTISGSSDRIESAFHIPMSVDPDDWWMLTMLQQHILRCFIPILLQESGR